MGLGSFIGGQIGASFVIYKSTRFLRIIFLTIITLCVTYSFIKFYGLT